MHKTGLLKLIPLLFLFSACSDKYEISFFCEKDKKDNYIIKWEVFPTMENLDQINIYSSRNDSVFPSNPRITTLVSDYVSILPPTENIFREFFKLKVDKSTSGIITNRFFNTKNIQNFRDLGGYFTLFDRQVKWGKVYRSAQLDNLMQEDKDILDSLKIKTVIDFRSNEQSLIYPDFKNDYMQYVHIPIEVNYFNENIQERILQGSFLKGDAMIYTQDCYRNIIENHASAYAQFFDVLSEPSNYPVVFHCGWGKDRTGLAAYFLLKILNVLPESIEQDYMYSNIGIDKRLIIEDIHELPESAQEAVTMLSVCELPQLKYAIYCIKKKSGSVDEYIRKELKVTPEKALALQKLLLY